MESTRLHEAGKMRETGYGNNMYSMYGYLMSMPYAEFIGPKKDIMKKWQREERLPPNKDEIPQVDFTKFQVSSRPDYHDLMMARSRHETA